ncbi:DciA family protein [Corynebacterium propinquum]|nr:DciA family protein [Corynebacterium propinquum]MDK4257665.1 DciA family protein [Corynebacterium propinquum]MDK4291944.1 DciA family protein [Corynebacterium propinquum]MDK4298202.1 DciA family protein [Corynebacterium propinquum]
MSIPEESPAPNQKNQQSQSDSQPRDLVDATFAALREAAAQRGSAPPLGTSQTGAQSFLRSRRQARAHRARNSRLSAATAPFGPSTNTPGTSHAPGALNWGKYRQSGPDGRRPRRQLNLPSAGAVLNKEITSRGWEKNLASGWVTGHWEQLVGEKIAQHTKVEMVKDTALFITCDSTAWATNLRYMQREILRSIREKAGPDVITELKIFGPQAPNWRKGKLHVKGRGPRDTYG